MGILTATCLGSGCYVERSAIVKPDGIVGDYIHRSGDKGARYDPDRLTLRSDGKYILIRMPGGVQGVTEEGTWRLVQDAKPTVLLDHAGYDVKLSDRKVRLIISYDRDQWYEKIE